MKPKVIFILSLLAVPIVLLVAWRRDPSYSTFPTPGITAYLAIFGFVIASLLIFFANLVLAFSRGRKAKSEEELETIVAPALQGWEYDERILRWTVIPRALVSGVALGALSAVIIHYLMR